MEEKRLENKLFVVEGANVARYNSALEKFGLDKVKMENFEIDRQGYSPQIGAKLEENYLENKIIIVDKMQETAPLLKPDYCTFMDRLLQKVYSELSSLIITFTPYEALIGNVIIVPTKKAQDLELTNILYGFNLPQIAELRANMLKAELIDADSNFFVLTAMDTPKGTVKNINHLIREINKLDDNHSLLLNNKYLDDILLQIKEINRVYGNIRKLELNLLKPAVLSVNEFKIRSGNRDIYVLSKGDKTLAVYFGRKLKKASRLIEGKDREAVLTSLLLNNFAEVNIKLAEKRIKEIEKEVLEESQQELKSASLMEKYRKLETLKPVISKEHTKKLSDLWKVIKDKQNFDKLSTDLKFELVILTCDNPLVKEVLRRAQIE